MIQVVILEVYKQIVELKMNLEDNPEENSFPLLTTPIPAPKMARLWVHQYVRNGWYEVSSKEELSRSSAQAPSQHRVVEKKKPAYALYRATVGKSTTIFFENKEDVSPSLKNRCASY